MRTPLPTRSALLCAFLALASATCATNSVKPGEPGQQAPRLLVCTATGAPAGTQKKVVGPDSGRVELEVPGPRGSHRLVIPQGAVKEQTTFVLTAHASDTVKVEAYAEGHRTFTFANGRRATLWLDAEHCPAAFGRLERKQIYRIEPTGLVPVGGTGVGTGPQMKAVLRTELPSLSGYALGGS